MRIHYNNKKIEITVRKVNFFGKVFGLMFKSVETENLLFENSFDSRMAIHSWFVFFDFLAVWLDSRNRVVEVKKVKPFTFLVKPEKNFRKLIEIPLNNRNRRIIDFLVGKKKDLNI